jgi:hypothetical protein
MAEVVPVAAQSFVAVPRATAVLADAQGPGVTVGALVDALLGPVTPWELRRDLSLPSAQCATCGRAFSVVGG